MAKSLKQLDALDNLGQSKSDFDTVLSAAEKACADFITRIKENIQAIPDMVNSGSIENLTIESSGDEIHIKGSQHLLYQNYGVRGSQSGALASASPYAYTDKRPPVDAFLAYIQSKNIRLINNPKYTGNPSPFKEVSEEKQQLKLAWAMSTKVFQIGFKPQPIKWDEEKEVLKHDLKENAKGYVMGKLKTEIYNQYGQNVEAKPK